MTNPGSLRYGGCAAPPTAPTHHARPPHTLTERTHRALPPRAPAAHSPPAATTPSPLHPTALLTPFYRPSTALLPPPYRPPANLIRYFGVLTLQREALPDDEAADQRRPRWCVLGF